VSNTTMTEPTLDELEVAFETLSPDGLVKNIQRFRRLFAQGKKSITDGIARLAVARTRSGKAHVSSAVSMLFGAYVASKVSDLSATDAYKYASALSKDTSQDFGVMTATIDKMKSVKQVLDATQALTDKALAEKTPQVVPTALEALSSTAGTFGSKAAKDGVPLESALAVVAEAIIAQYRAQGKMPEVKITEEV